MTIQSWLPQYHELIETAIVDFFDTRYGDTFWVESEFESAIRYAVEWGWKRLRPILAMVTFESASGMDIWFWSTNKWKELLRALLGIECIHCYTLVHDDLPCMDDDELRRGKLTVWKKYGEAMALLVWDTLQTMGFELLATTGESRVVGELAQWLWDMGVVRGQVRDTFLRHDALSLTDLLRIHDEKTGGFIARCLVIGALLGKAPETEIESFRRFGLMLGRAFQIQDDILDATGDAAEVWKNTGKDADLGKGAVSLLGLPGAMILIWEIEQELEKMSQCYSDPRFREIWAYVIHRSL